MPFASSAEELAAEKEPDLRRSRSQGHGNIWEQQQRRERYERGLQLEQRDHRRHRHGSSLTVPTFPYGQDWTQKQSQYRTQGKQDAGGELGYSTILRAPTEPKSGDLPVRASSQRSQRRPVEIHQDKTSRGPSPARTISTESGASLSDLWYQLDKVATKLDDVSETCSRKRDGGVDSSRMALSFGGIAAQLNGDAFRLRIWSYEVGLQERAEVESSRRKNVETAQRSMQRIMERAIELAALCVRAQYQDLQVSSIEPDQRWEDYDSSDEDGEEERDGKESPTELLGFEIKACLDSISFQIQTLSRMTQPLHDATLPDGSANEEVEAVDGLVAEVAGYFGSLEALRGHKIDEKFAGRKALEEARYTAGVR